MLAAKTAGLHQGQGATDLTALLGIDGPATVMCRMPYNSTGDGVAVRIGDADVSPSSGYTLDINAPQAVVKIQAGDRLYASWAGGSQGSAQLDVLAYTST